MSGATEVEGAFRRTRAVSGRVIHLEETGSTNDDLVSLAPEVDDSTVVVSLGQRSGKGRLDRRWTAPRGQMLAASVLLRPGGQVPDDVWGWFSLVAGFVLKGVLQDELPGREVQLKWPNDVQVGGDKISGILAELTTRDGRADAVVLGVGLNLTIDRENLPTSTSTSLLLEGREGTAEEMADEVLASFVAGWRRASATLLGGGDGAARLRDAVAAACDTIGRRVRVELPGGDMAYGTATGLDPRGRLVVLQDDNAGTLTVAAGDVTHLRYE
ncbi:MAG: hypothetical protein JWP75_456 [Frondihabitans sp.]|nr:hypothetical protein [Frondihabitans sp.]